MVLEAIPKEEMDQTSVIEKICTMNVKISLLHWIYRMGQPVLGMNRLKEGNDREIKEMVTTMSKNKYEILLDA